MAKLTHIGIGKLGEDLACRYLVKNGYRILTKNYRKPWGEIDIIGKAKDGTLVFFEVKTIKASTGEGLQPEDNLTAAKLKKLRRVCQMFAIRNQEVVDDKKGWGIDLLAITLPRGGLTESSKNCIIKHYKNI